MDRVFVTADSSHSIHSSAFGVPFHSTHGAISETQHVFIEAGLKFQMDLKKEIRIFEMGFGTGLNTFMTAWATGPPFKINYTSIDLYPLGEYFFSKLNYGEIIGDQNLFKKIVDLEWNKKEQITDSFELEKLPISLLKMPFEEKGPFDLIYFDAFAPNAQPELWDASIFRRIFDAMSTGGCLVTYCAKGSFKRDLKTIGFEVQSLLGPTGKREMTRALKL